MTKSRWIIFAIVVIGLLSGLVVYNKIQTASLPKSPGSNNIYGLAESKLVLTEYVDFQCEACRGYYPTMKEIKEKYKDQITIQIKHLPISTSHPLAKKAASFAEAAAKQGQFFGMHDKIFEGQTTWQASSKPEELFFRYAEELGMDMNKFRTDQASTEVTAIINADADEAKQIGATGTPTFAINGSKVENPDNSVEAISKLIDDAIAEMK